MVQPRRYVAAPAVAPLPFGLQSVSLVSDDADPHNGFGIEFETVNCGTAHRSISACFDDQNQGAPFTISDEAQLVTEGGAGLTSFTLTFSGQTTGSIAAGATAAAVQAALEALSNIAPGDVAVSGANGGPYTVVFGGAWADQDVPQMTTTPTGGTGTVTVTTTTAGGFMTQSDDGVDLVQTDPFMVFALHTCRNIGGNANAQQRAEDKLRIGEWRAIEEGFALDALVPVANDLTPTPGTPVRRIDGLAILQQWAASNYGGVPTIHMSRHTATQLMMSGVVGPSGSRLQTGLESPVAAGGGYDFDASLGAVDGVTAGAGERWMFATGAVVVARGPVQTSDVTQQQTGVGAARGYTNELAVLAQRAVSAAFECFSIAVLVDEMSS